jgi:HlyD family secretion protein
MNVLQRLFRDRRAPANTPRFWPRLSLAAVVVTTALVGCNRGPVPLQGSGTVEADEIVIAARTQGEVLEIVIREGDHVSANEALARLDDADLQLQLEQARQRRAVVVAQRNLLTAGARPEDIRQAEAGLAELQEALRLAERNYERIRNLHEAGSSTPSELDRVETQFHQAQARVDAAEAQLARVRDLPRDQEIEAARAQVAEADAAVARIERQVQEAVIRAPRDGTVVTRLRHAGEYVAPGTPLFIMADLSVVTLTVYVPEPHLAEVALGATVTVRVDGVTDRAFSGRVSGIATEAEFTPRNVQTADARAQLVYAVDVEIENPDGVFKIGMPAEAVFAP